ncbi:hypothetical protein KM043_007564 [Ampulex compressa]|nr:hypothetical protein KM043_007564 [Ampulex compressa]
MVQPGPPWDRLNRGESHPSSIYATKRDPVVSSYAPRVSNSSLASTDDREDGTLEPREERNCDARATSTSKIAIPSTRCSDFGAATRAFPGRDSIWRFRLNLDEALTARAQTAVDGPTCAHARDCRLRLFE